MTDEELIIYIESLNSRIEIDKYNLPEECVKQPSLFNEVSAKLPELIKKSKAAKDKVDRVKAELNIKIRQNPDAYGLTGIKLTENVYDSAIVNQRQYQDAFDEYLSADEICTRYKFVKDAVEVKKSMIRDLVSLAEKEFYQEKAVAPMHSEHKRISEATAASYAKGRTELRNRRRERAQERAKERDEERTDEERG